MIYRTCLPLPHLTPASWCVYFASPHPAPGTHRWVHPAYPMQLTTSHHLPFFTHLASIFFAQMHVTSCVHHQIECKKFRWKGFFNLYPHKKNLFQSDFCAQSCTQKRLAVRKVWYLLPRPSSWYTEKKLLVSCGVTPLTSSLQHENALRPRVRLPEPRCARFFFLVRFAI